MNKAILSTRHFPFPFFLTAWHMLFATITTQIFSRLVPSLFPGVISVKYVKI